jgi:hypothetical protein
MRRKGGMRAWPPIWTTTRREEKTRPWGEVGTLERVLVSDFIDGTFFLRIEYKGLRYMGALAFDDPLWSHQIRTIFESHVAFTIRDIGNIDIPSTF